MILAKSRAEGICRPGAADPPLAGVIDLIVKVHVSKMWVLQQVFDRIIALGRYVPPFADIKPFSSGLLGKALHADLEIGLSISGSGRGTVETRIGL